MAKSLPVLFGQKIRRLMGRQLLISPGVHSIRSRPISNFEEHEIKYTLFGKTCQKDLQKFAEPVGIHRMGPGEKFVPFGIQSSSRKAILGDIDPTNTLSILLPSSQGRQDEPSNQTSIVTRVR